VQDGKHGKKWHGRELRLTPLEHRILESLARHADRIVTHKQLMRELWGSHQTDPRALRVYIDSLRRKLEDDPNLPKHIVTQAGVGYRLVIELTRESAPCHKDIYRVISGILRSAESSLLRQAIG
jgi:DNA-binding response OmpR family regulator